MDNFEYTPLEFSHKRTKDEQNETKIQCNNVQLTRLKSTGTEMMQVGLESCRHSRICSLLGTIARAEPVFVIHSKKKKEKIRKMEG